MKPIVVIFSTSLYQIVPIITNLVSQDEVGRSNLVLTDNYGIVLPVGYNFTVIDHKDKSLKEMVEFYSQENYGTFFILASQDNFQKYINSTYITGMLIIKMLAFSSYEVVTTDFIMTKSYQTKAFTVNLPSLTPGFFNSVPMQFDIEIKKYIRLYNNYDYQFQDLVQRIISTGEKKTTRGVTTLSVSGALIEVDLKHGFPISTLKRGWWKGVVEETLWFMRGTTNAKELSDKGVKIWDKNTTREFLDRNGLSHYPVGDVGPGYGFQMRHAGAPYTDCETKDVQGVDQLVNAIKTLKNDPHNRRILINLWSVPQIKEMALPPCHLLYQFVCQDGRLDGHLYQRSWDVSLGWNSSTLALIVHLVAHQVDMKPGVIHHYIADAHIYEEHVDKMKVVLERVPFDLPQLKIMEKADNVWEYELKDLVLENYESHDKVAMEMIEGN